MYLLLNTWLAAHMHTHKKKKKNQPNNTSIPEINQKTEEHFIKTFQNYYWQNFKVTNVLTFFKESKPFSSSLTKFQSPSNHWYLCYQQMNNEYTNTHTTPRKSKAITNFYHFVVKMLLVFLFSKLWSLSVHTRTKISSLKRTVISFAARALASQVKINQ